MIYPLENKKSSSPSGALIVIFEELMKTENLEVKERKFSLNPSFFFFFSLQLPVQPSTGSPVTPKSSSPAGTLC